MTENLVLKTNDHVRFAFTERKDRKKSRTSPVFKFFFPQRGKKNYPCPDAVEPIDCIFFNFLWSLPYFLLRFVVGSFDWSAFNGSWSSCTSASAITFDFFLSNLLFHLKNLNKFVTFSGTVGSNLEMTVWVVRFWLMFALGRRASPRILRQKRRLWNDILVDIFAL